MIWVTRVFHGLRRGAGIKGLDVDRRAARWGDTAIWADCGSRGTPASMMMMAMTQAKTGRSRKNFDNIRLPPFNSRLPAAGLSSRPPDRPCRPASKGTTFTEAPGRTFWMPSTITRSPGARPDETSHLSPMARSTVIIRCWTLPPPSTISAGVPLGVAGDPLLRGEDCMVDHPLLDNGAHVHARQKRMLRVRERPCGG